MLWRSVVGKLWGTIILLVAVVLIFLTFLLLQFFEQFHKSEAEQQLMSHANVVVSVLEEYDDPSVALQTIEKIANTYNTKVVIIRNDEEWQSSNELDAGTSLPLEIFREHEELSSVQENGDRVVTQLDYNGEELQAEIFIVGLPYQLVNGDNGSIYLYQSLSVIENTTGKTKQIILLSAGIAIILTTVFAFFLSSRVTAPLRKMRQLALNVAKGDFNTKVPILTNDEIGQLGIAFNKMRRELNQNIAALNQEKEQLSRILSSMADGVITIDRKGTIIVTNPPAHRFLEMYRYEHQDYDELSLPKELKKLFQHVVAQEKEQLAEMDIQGRSYAILMTPLYDQNFVRGVVAVIRDMTEERQHDKLRKDFIANVSHELRTPISMLQGYSEAIIDDMATSEEEMKEIVKIIYDESKRMNRLVNELLDIARMEAGHIQLDKQKTDIHALANKVYKKFQGLAKEAEVELSITTTGTEPIQFLDPDRIEQVMTNLIHNAIRHTDKDGTVRITVEAKKEGTKVSVKDDGTGIPEEDLPYVFERFYKADKARTRSNGGTGLGLAIAKNIVEAHGGEISVHSKLGEGALFRFFLPATKEEQKS
ncbi:ATP-binding protein [Aliibacillus thermotolerans]|uniref:histidine kinase n=1 Tax=Aliibacillus thermotolerans TaxID=1834418 RepID=A0ABW0U8L0_9BACI|nr:ATP-binding protein [Aliibacillus thermotolerans]MDA3128655.1 HAMP domain-containing protein [Aliibacillus thermotolerans]